jgi:predicted nucleic acid-binding protein
VILADTSIWVAHVRTTDPELRALLESRSIVTHPLVIGEVAMGNLPRRSVFLDNLGKLPRAIVATDAEAMSLMERERLFGLGLGYVDLHLLAGVLLTPGAVLWTSDRRLRDVAVRMGVAR